MERGLNMSAERHSYVFDENGNRYEVYVDGNIGAGWLRGDVKISIRDQDGNEVYYDDEVRFADNRAMNVVIKDFMQGRIAGKDGDKINRGFTEINFTGVMNDRNAVNVFKPVDTDEMDFAYELQEGNFKGFKDPDDDSIDPKKYGEDYTLDKYLTDEYSYSGNMDDVDLMDFNTKEFTDIADKYNRDLQNLGSEITNSMEAASEDASAAISKGGFSGTGGLTSRPKDKDLKALDENARNARLGLATERDSDILAAKSSEYESFITSLGN